MRDFESKWWKELANEPEFDSQRADMHLQEAMMEFAEMTDRRLRRALWATWGCHVLFAVFLFVGIALVRFTSDMMLMLFGVMAFVAGLVGLAIIKLWFWVVHARLLMLREIKQIQLQVAELAAGGKKP